MMVWRRFVWRETSSRVVFAVLSMVFAAVPTSAQLFADPVPAHPDNVDSDEYCSIATDEAGLWMAVWEFRLGGTGDSDIAWAMSEDNGDTWTTGVLNSNAGTDVEDDVRPHIATDRNGTWMVVWHSATNLPAIGGDEDILYSVWTEDTEAWTAPFPLNQNAGTDGSTEDLYPRLATDGEGRWVAVWSTGGSFGLNKLVNTAFSDNDGVTWSAQSAIDEDVRIVATQSPDIDYADGVWMVVWSAFGLGAQFGGEAEVVASASSDGAMWSAPVAVNDYATVDEAPDEYARIVAGGAGVWIAVWESAHDIGGIGTDKDIMFARSTDDGVSWSSAAALNATAATDSGADTTPVVASDKQARMFCIWTSKENFAGSGADSDLFLARSSDSGLTWSTVTVVNTTAAEDGGTEHDEHCALATDRNGRWTAIWDTVGGALDGSGPDGDVSAAAAQFPDPFDINMDGLVNAADIQTVINAALGLDVGGLDTDINNDGSTDAVDVQSIIIEVLQR